MGQNSYRRFPSVSPGFLSSPCLPSNSKIPSYTPLLKWFFSNCFHRHSSAWTFRVIFHKLLYKIPTCLAITSFTNRTTPSSNQTNIHHSQKHVSLCTLHNLPANFRKNLKDFPKGSPDALSKECWMLSRLLFKDYFILWGVYLWLSSACVFCAFMEIKMDI